MIMRPRASWGVLLLCAVGCSVRQAQPPQQAAPDLILYNGRVITVDAHDRVLQAVAIAGSRIVAVGRDADVLELAGPATRRIDLRGHAVTPGLLDAHAHFALTGATTLYVLNVGYPAVKSIRDIVDSVRARVAQLPPGAFIEGRGWDEGKFVERRMITARDLDAAAPNNPVYLTNTTGHYGVANSAALRLANITRETTDPPNGTIDREADGTPTGVLKEAAQGLVRRLVPGRTREEIERGIRELAKAFNAEGMTGLKEPGTAGANFDTYRKLAAEGALPVRVFALFPGGDNLATARSVIAEHAATTRPYESTGDDHVIPGGVKLFIDGSGGARTAWLYDDWNKNFTDTDTGNKGYPTTNPDTLRQMIKLYHQAGMHVSVHSIGDRAIDWTIDSYAEALREAPQRGLRHGIIHANIPTDRALAEMVRLQRDFDAGYPEPSATFHWWIGDNYAGNFGPTRSKRLNPFRTYQSKGIIWANGSDTNVTPYPARYGIWAAVARQTLLEQYGDAFGRAEAIDVRTALKAVTIWAARQMFMEKKIGSIEPGKYADLAIWDRDPYRVPTADLKDMKCLLTIFNGKVVFQAAASPLQMAR